MELIFTLIAAIAPAIILAIILIRRDKVHPEPIGWLLGATALGVVAALLVILLSFIGLEPVEVNSFFGAFYNAFITAALPEEAAKLCMLAIIANRCKHFDEYFDGIVYAVCIGMGFAGFENILYLCGEDEWLIIGISRALLSVPAHYFFAVIMGSFFALAYFDKRNKKLYMSMAFFVPFIAHGLYDFMCFSVNINENLSMFILLAFIAGFRWIRRYAKQLMDSMLRLDSYSHPTE